MFKTLYLFNEYLSISITYYVSEILMNYLKLYFIYKYSSISITYYVTEILVYKFVIYEGLEFWLMCLNIESMIDQEWVN